MKVYISGKITGLDIEDVKRMFQLAENMLKIAYVDVINPMKISPQKFEPTWKDYMIADIEKLIYCDAIFMIHNWKDSKGAILEHHIAKELGLEIIYDRSNK